MPSFYAPHLKTGIRELFLAGDEAHHISHVFRHRLGDEISLTNGCGLLAKAHIIGIAAKEIKLSVSFIEEKTLSHPPLAVAFPLLKNKHDFLIVEKLTELGVKDLFPLCTKRSVRTTSANTQSKFEKIAIAAIKQGDNAFLPNIRPVQRLQDFLNESASFQPLVALEKGKHRSLLKLAADFADQPVCLIIGPEGGFDEEEREYFKIMKIPAFTLGNHILRAETAAIAAASQFLAFRLLRQQEYY